MADICEIFIEFLQVHLEIEIFRHADIDHESKKMTSKEAVKSTFWCPICARV